MSALMLAGVVAIAAALPGDAPDTSAAPSAGTVAVIARTPVSGTARKVAATGDPAGLARADTTIPRRPRAIEYSDAYATRLTIHRVASYAEIPLFAGEYWLGERLLSSNPQPGWVKPTHVGGAAALGALFTVNTVTGVWNLYDARHDPADRTRRYLHSALMLAADAGFAYTGAVAGDAEHSPSGARATRTRPSSRWA